MTTQQNLQKLALIRYIVLYKPLDLLIKRFAKIVMKIRFYKKIQILNALLYIYCNMYKVIVGFSFSSHSITLLHSHTDGLQDLG